MNSFLTSDKPISFQTEKNLFGNTAFLYVYSMIYDLNLDYEQIYNMYKYFYGEKYFHYYNSLPAEILINKIN